MTQATTTSLPSAPASAPERERATKHLDDLRPRLAQLAADALLRPRVSPDWAIALTGELLATFGASVHAPGELSDAAWQRVQRELGEVMGAALAYFAAQDVIEKAAPTQRLARKRELQLKVRAHDAFLGKWARTAFEDDAVEAPTVAALVPGSGTYDDAQDTVGWVAMWRRHPDARAKSPVSEAYLDEAEADATELLPLIEADDSDPARRELARRAYTLWSDLYNHILQVGRFLRGDGVAWSGIAPPARPAREPDAEATTPATAATGDDGHATA